MFVGHDEIFAASPQPQPCGIRVVAAQCVMKNAGMRTAYAAAMSCANISA